MEAVIGRIRFLTRDVWLLGTLVGAGLVVPTARAAEPVGVVAHVSVLSDKVPDVSSLEAWKKSFIRDAMSEKEKALAAFKTEVMFQQADAPPQEFLQRENVVLDPIKIFNVYGYTMCSISAANVACLSRYVGLKARNSTINNHTIPEIYYDGAWHMLDADLIEYFPKADGAIASTPEIVAGVQGWLKSHPDFPIGPGGKQARYEYMAQKGWKTSGPEVLSRNPFYDDHGWLPCADFAWGDTVAQFSKISNTWESCYSMGYQVNVELRVGEKMTRNWSNVGLHVDKDLGEEPQSLKAKIGRDSFRQAPKWGDLAPGRIGNGAIEYDVPLASGAFRGGASTAQNVASQSEDATLPAVHVKDSASSAVLEFRMPSSYVYLRGRAEVATKLGDGGQIDLLFSDNNGLDWKKVKSLADGPQKVDLTPLVYRRYSYMLRFVMNGKGTGLDSLKITDDIQQSQRALPALGQGDNTISFSSGPPEGTITVEGAMDLPAKDAGKQLRWSDFHARVQGLDVHAMPHGTGTITFPVKTPGDMTRIRASDYFISEGGAFVIDVSFDMGKTWKPLDPLSKDNVRGCKFVGRYAKFENVPKSTRFALIRYRTLGGTAALCNARIDADYNEQFGGFRPVRVTYRWFEQGLEKTDVHVVSRPTQIYHIGCVSKPIMKSLVLELPE